MPFFLTWLITAISLLITAYVIPGIFLKSFIAAAFAAVVMGIINAVVRPILILFTLPLTFLSLGLFLFVVNAIAFSLVSYFTPGFNINTFWDALFGSIILSIVSGFLGEILETRE
ncbi:phage holin family protein [Cyanobacterium sp. uoEpiScrs1]|uniref:phage holin family protein n=1 Tax=Cyanobacterium sp. uoEpiScrs1 TaxID=2976343 RepID=UPI002269D499|nr:phage holin family protein [Cyanobacterium sp. uoEpiScrs1]